LDLVIWYLVLIWDLGIGAWNLCLIIIILAIYKICIPFVFDNKVIVQNHQLRTPTYNPTAIHSFIFTFTSIHSFIFISPYIHHLRLTIKIDVGAIFKLT